MSCLITYIFTGLKRERKYNVQVPQRNEMLSLNCTTLGFISKNEEYNPEYNIPNGNYLKNLILQNVVKQ